MRYEDSHKKHGVVRIEYRNGSVEEGTWYGLGTRQQPTYGSGRHGLRRMIVNELVYLEFYFFNDLVLHSAFDGDFVEVDRFSVDVAGESTYLYMQEMYGYRFVKERNDTRMFLNMLKSSPVKAGIGEAAMWKRMNPLSLPELEFYHAITEQDEPLIDWEKYEYSEWSTEKDSRLYGTRSIDTGQEAGVVREVAYTWVYERSHNSHGAVSGLCRSIINRVDQNSADRTTVDIKLEGVPSPIEASSNGQISFNWMFEITATDDPGHLLADLDPKKYKLPDGEALDNTFATTPFAASDEAIAVWLKQRRMTTEYFRLWWDKLNITDEPLIDSNLTHYDFYVNDVIPDNLVEF
jgi:hypothetical protein